MKRIVEAGKERGRANRCDTCHENLETYVLLDGARERLEDLLRLLGEAPAPSSSK